LIDEMRGDVIERSIRATCHDLEVVVHAVGMMPEHLHVVLSVPPRHAVANVVKRIKGESSHLLNHSAGSVDSDWFGWQPEYGVVSFSERALPDVVAYAKNQRAKHAADALWPTYEIIEQERPSFESKRF
jgi:putative transposase